VFVAYYVIGLPCAYVLAFRYNLGIDGLCIGTTLGTWIHMIFYLVVVGRFDWSMEAVKASVSSVTCADGTIAKMEVVDQKGGQNTVYTLVASKEDGPRIT
jgi:hypothetical protein